MTSFTSQTTQLVHTYSTPWRWQSYFMFLGLNHVDTNKFIRNEQWRLYSITIWRIKWKYMRVESSVCIPNGAFGFRYSDLLCDLTFWGLGRNRVHLNAFIFFWLNSLPSSSPSTLRRLLIHLPNTYQLW